MIVMDKNRLNELVSIFEQSQYFSNIGSWEINLVTKELYWSDNIFRMLGFSVGEVEPTYERFIESVHPDDLSFTEEAIAKCITDGHPYDIRHRIIRKDKKIVWFRDRGNVVLDKNENPPRLLGTAQDITHEVELEKKNEDLLIELQQALSEVKVLQGIIPICSYCHEIRDDKGAWEQMEAYISRHSEAEFSHSICPKCLPNVRKEIADMKARKG